MTPYLRQLFGFFVSSFKALLRTPSAWLFGLLFPIIFVVLFGFISNNSTQEIKIGLIFDDSELYEPLKASFTNIKAYQVEESEDYEALKNKLAQGELDGLVRIESQKVVNLTYNANRPENVSVIVQTLDKINNELTFEKAEIAEKAFEFKQNEVNSRQSRYIDFVLPGILGYSIMSATIFGVAFSFLTLRKENVLKRLFAGPAKISAFILGESISRGIYILIQNLILLGIASLAFGFRTRNGLEGFVSTFVIIILGLLVFLGFGYVVAAFAKTDEVVTPVANLFVLPQFILAGTFFPVTSLPDWLALIARIMPLHHFNQAIRYVTIDGLSLFDPKVSVLLLFLLLWGVLAYGLAVKFFRIR